MHLRRPSTWQKPLRKDLEGPAREARDPRQMVNLAVAAANRAGGVPDELARLNALASAAGGAWLARTDDVLLLNGYGLLSERDAPREGLDLLAGIGFMPAPAWPRW